MNEVIRFNPSVEDISAFVVALGGEVIGRSRRAGTGAADDMEVGQ